MLRNNLNVIRNTAMWSKLTNSDDILEEAFTNIDLGCTDNATVTSASVQANYVSEGEDLVCSIFESIDVSVRVEINTM